MDKNKEIDIIGIVKRVIKDPKWLIFSIIIGALLGVVVALNTPKQYTANVILAPEMSGGGLGLSEGLSDMASNFGIDLNSSNY